VRLELLAPRSIPSPAGPPPIEGTTGTPAGVGTLAPAPIAGVIGAPARGRLGWRGALAIVFACLSLLGQGERARVDPRYRSPSSVLLTYWEALREGDADRVSDCYLTDRADLPMPGALWFLPPTDDLWLANFRSLPVTSGRVMVRYEVHYRPLGTGEERMFETGNEVVRQRGEWRIAQTLGEASMPEWKPEPAVVDM
jgi:hypothetical protein